METVKVLDENIQCGDQTTNIIKRTKTIKAVAPKHVTAIK